MTELTFQHPLPADAALHRSRRQHEVRGERRIPQPAGVQEPGVAYARTSSTLGSPARANSASDVWPATAATAPKSRTSASESFDSIVTALYTSAALKLTVRMVDIPCHVLHVSGKC